MKELSKQSTARDHLANERTFLSWIRTSIGIMAFGFVVEKFGLFIKEIGSFVGSKPSSVPEALSHFHPGYSSIFGVILIAFGAIIGIFSFIQYKRVSMQIENDTYKPPSGLASILTIAIVMMAVFLIIYLINPF